MIYRISRLHDEAKFEMRVLSKLDGSSCSGSLNPQDYSSLFEEVDVDRADVHLYIAPLIPNWKDKYDLEIESPPVSVSLLPDFIFLGRTFVSKKMKEVIENTDDFGHQFTPSILRFSNGDKLEDFYYQLSVRRLLKEDSLVEDDYDGLLLWRMLNDNIVDNYSVYIDSVLFDSFSESELKTIWANSDFRVLP